MLSAKRGRPTTERNRPQPPSTKRQQQKKEQQLGRYRTTATASNRRIGLGGDGSKQRQIAGIKGQVGNVFLTEIHLLEWVFSDDIVLVLNHPGSVGIQLQQCRMKPAITDFLAVECKHNPTASKLCDLNAVAENGASANLEDQ